MNLYNCIKYIYTCIISIYYLQLKNIFNKSKILFSQTLTFSSFTFRCFLFVNLCSVLLLYYKATVATEAHFHQSSLKPYIVPHIRVLVALHLQWQTDLNSSNKLVIYHSII